MGVNRAGAKFTQAVKAFQKTEVNGEAKKGFTEVALKDSGWEDDILGVGGQHLPVLRCGKAWGGVGSIFLAKKVSSLWVGILGTCAGVGKH